VKFAPALETKFRTDNIVTGASPHDRLERQLLGTFHPEEEMKRVRDALAKRLVI